jgi:hypothetical protein
MTTMMVSQLHPSVPCFPQKLMCHVKVFFKHEVDGERADILETSFSPFGGHCLPAHTPLDVPWLISSSLNVAHPEPST